MVKRQLLDERAGDGFDANLIKEGDLKNHLAGDNESEVIDEIDELIDGAEDKNDDKASDKEEMTEAERIIRLGMPCTSTAPRIPMPCFWTPRSTGRMKF
ncbi:MAG: hypothetical protein R2860_02640 [Desulfobacterales bacterium]